MDIKQAFRKILIQTALFHIFVSILMFGVLKGNLNKEDLDVFCFFAFFGALVMLILCLFEAGLFDDTGKRFFAIGGTLLWYYKLLCVVLFYAAILIFRSYASLILSIIILTAVEYIVLVLSFKKPLTTSIKISLGKPKK